MGKLEKEDFNHILHHLRGEELKQLPKNVKNFLSVGCAGTWYFLWVESCCGPLGRHIGIEYYSPRPSDLPPNAEWIENTAGDMAAIRDESCEVLFSGQNIEHLWPEEIANFLCESHRVLKPGGLLVIDSPNRLATEKLCWSHPEHTFELSPDEAHDLLELSGFEVTAMRGMWLCLEPGQGRAHRLEELHSIGAWSVKTRITRARARPNEAFCWWLEARKTSRIADVEEVKEATRTIFRRAWPKRVNRLHTMAGEELLLEGRSWLRSHGKPGVLMYGPFMPLPAGRYTVRFELRWTDGSSSGPAEAGRVDAIAGDSRELATSTVFHSQLSVASSTFMSVAFQLDEMTFGIQFRMIVAGAGQVMAFRGVELTCHTNPALDVSRPIQGEDVATPPDVGRHTHR
jgi:SAM-dependent methyltransferase